MTISPSAPQYSDLYSQSPSNAGLVEAQAVSFRQTYDGPNYNNQAKPVPSMVTIPSSNVLLENSAPGEEETTTSYQQEYYTNPSPIIRSDPPQPQRLFRGRLVKAKNAHLPDSVLDFKERRKERTIVSTVTGGVIGLFALGPVGAVLGAASAYGIAKGVGKSRERKLIERTGTLPSRISTSAVPETAQHSYPEQYQPQTAHPARPLPRIV